MSRYANVDKLMEHAISLDWSVLKWVNEVDISTAINPNVVERKKGKWIVNKGLYQCSCCKHIWSELWWVESCPMERMYKIMPFCPNCGADMRKESDNG